MVGYYFVIVSTLLLLATAFNAKVSLAHFTEYDQALPENKKGGDWVVVPINDDVKTNVPEEHKFFWWRQERLGSWWRQFVPIFARKRRSELSLYEDGYAGAGRRRFGEVSRKMSWKGNRHAGALLRLSNRW
uniref:Uncharacterized protein n=1 Tax=Plectus sambesii TaxID=2011161 RepID=A0A914V375_9BILA